MAHRSVRPLGHDAGRLATAERSAYGDGSPPHGWAAAGAAPACPVDDGTSCRQPSPRPGPTREFNRLATMPAADKLLEAMRRAAPLLPAGLRDEFLGLLSPVNVAVTAGVLAVWAASHAF